MKSVGISGIGTFLPENVVTNLDLEKVMDTSDEWIRSRTGIEERRLVDKGTLTSDIATKAALKAIEDANISPEDIDMILVATATPDHNFPSVACKVQKNINAKNSSALDISAACSGFIYGLVVAKHFIELGTYEHVLVIGAETLSSLIDWEDRNTAVLFGDGAGAVVLSSVSENRGILSFELGADGKGSEHLYSNPEIVMNGREVFKFAVRQMPASAENVVSKAGLTKDDVDFLIPHQANIRIIDAARERLKLPKEKVSTTIKLHGNTSAASIPLALDYELKNNKIKDGDNLVFVGFGGGLTWGAICLKWGK